MENEDKTESSIQSDWLEIDYKDDQDSVIVEELFFADCAAFPPDNHQELPIDSLNLQERPSTGAEGGGDAAVDDRNVGNDGMGFLSSAFSMLVSGVKRSGVSREKLWWFASATAAGVGALAVAVVLNRRVRRWRQRKVQPESNKQHQLMLLLLKSKDQKIDELMLQIAHLNDSLLARRRVPVLQVG